MKKTNYTNNNYKTKQLKLPLEIEKIIEISDPVYSFCEIIDCIDLNSYFVKKGYKTGRPRYNRENLLKVILFSFMENGYLSLRGIEKACKTDIRYMYLLDDMTAPTFATIGNFIRENLTNTIENIFIEINKVIFEKQKVDLEHVYIDGTKIEANANKYTWVWKKSCITNRNKVFCKITELIEKMNKEELMLLEVKFEIRTEYARHIEICGEKRGSYSKIDKSATFMRIKTDYMGNDQLLPAYNLQIGVCEEYIATVDVKQYASDMDCFVPLMEKFNEIYGRYPKYPIADAGYGSYNNYLYCEQHGMEKFMKFTMFEKETKNEKYKNNPYRAVNFKRDGKGNIICPNNKKFKFKETRHIRGNQYGRTEEIYECEECSNCCYKQECCPKAKNNRSIRLNQELTLIHKEVLNNLNSIHGALLCMNRSIQAEGTFGIIKYDKSYKRLRRKGLENVQLEFLLVACRYNLYKYHNKITRLQKCA